MKQFLVLLIVLIPARQAWSQAGQARLHQSLQGYLGKGQLPADITLAGQILDDRGSVKPFKMVVKGIDKVRYESGETMTVFAGGGGWARTGGNGGKVQVLPAHAARRPEIIPFLDLLSEIDNSRIEVSSVQPVTVGGQALERVVLTLRDQHKDRRELRRPLDEQTSFYLDPATALVVRSEHTLTAANNMDSRFLSTIDFSDYRSVDGVAIPYRIVQTVGSGSTPLQRSTITITRVTLNQGIPDSTFMPPAPGGVR